MTTSLPSSFKYRRNGLVVRSEMFRVDCVQTLQLQEYFLTRIKQIPACPEESAAADEGWAKWHSCSYFVDSAFYLSELGLR